MATATEAGPLTEKQAEVFRFIYDTARDRGYQPSVRELMERFDWLSPRAVTAHLAALRRKGWVSPGAGKARNVVFLRRPGGSAFRGFADPGPASGPDAAPSPGLTGVQSRLFGFLYAAARDDGRQPGYREIMERFGWSSLNAVQGHISALGRKGYIDRSTPYRNRSIIFLLTPSGKPFRGFAERED
jgi:SOS-response transcriptional repressor LexA